MASRWPRRALAAVVLAAVALLPTATAYQTLISSDDLSRQVCSGMWARSPGATAGVGQDPFVEVIFAPASTGQLALVIYEWKDAGRLGVDTPKRTVVTRADEDESVTEERTYICTLSARAAGLCDEADLGKFIIQPASKAHGNGTIFTTSVRFSSSSNTGPFRYPVNKTGYYCVGVVPLSAATDENPEAATTSYTGVVDFENVFVGHLPASEYPKIGFYFTLFVVYMLLTAGWAALCFIYRSSLLPLQHYILFTLVFLTVEQLVQSSYYHYLNSTGHPGVAKVLLVLTAIMNAARNSIGFYLLLVVSMGWGTVRPSLGPEMLKVRILAAVHFTFGVLYSIGIVSIPLESAGFFIFFFVFPLAFSLTAFLMWIMWSLHATIADLGSRRQSFKKQMFTRLYRILICAVIVIGAFFVITSFSFSNRLDADYVPETWQSRWVLMDGWLGILWLITFSAIAFLWRPTSNNRLLALSDELAQDEDDADAFDADALERGGAEDDSEEYGKGESVPLHAVRSGGGRGAVGRDSVVFDVGEDDEEDDEEERGFIGSRRNGGPGSGRRRSGSPDDDEGRPPSYKVD